jgi:hypothetical protein
MHMHLIMTVNGIHMQLQLASTKEHIIKQASQGVHEMEETSLEDTHNLTREPYTFCSSNQACTFSWAIITNATGYNGRE